MPTLTTINTTIVICHTCHKSVAQQEAQSIKFVEPSGQYRNDREILRVTGEVAYECDSCWDAYLKAAVQ